MKTNRFNGSQTFCSSFRMSFAEITSVYFYSPLYDVLFHASMTYMFTFCLPHVTSLFASFSFLDGLPVFAFCWLLYNLLSPVSPALCWDLTKQRTEHKCESYVKEGRCIAICSLFLWRMVLQKQSPWQNGFSGEYSCMSCVRSSRNLSCWTICLFKVLKI
jgi:hypothetical protein